MARVIPFILNIRRSLPSMAARHTVHPEHKKAQYLILSFFVGLNNILLYSTLLYLYNPSCLSLMASRHPPNHSDLTSRF